MPPANFEAALHRYDDALSIRWGPVVNQWVLERKGRLIPALHRLLATRRRIAERSLRTSPHDPEALKWQKCIEEWQSSRSGKHVIGYVMTLDRRVFDSLWLRDYTKHGGVEASLNAMEAEEQRKELEGRRKQRAHWEDIARNSFDIQRWMNTKHSSEMEHQGKALELHRRATGRIRSISGKKVGGLLDQFGRKLAVTH